LSILKNLLFSPQDPSPSPEVVVVKEREGEREGEREREGLIGCRDPT
jgi:hypothetical protein